MQIGFVGLGNMGSAMARNLLKAGHAVTVYNRTRARAEEFANVAASLAEAAAGEVVITMLADDHAVEDQHLVDAMRPGAIHLSMSTISPALSEKLTHAHAQAGQVYVAAPVLGRPEAAAAAKLFILAAGPDAALATCRPVFEALGQRTFILGENPSAANVVKLSCNFLLAAAIESMAVAATATPYRLSTTLYEIQMPAAINNTGIAVASRPTASRAWRASSSLMGSRIAANGFSNGQFGFSTPPWTGQ